MKYELDASDWPLIINEKAQPFRIMARFELPPSSTGLDPAAGRALLAARAALEIFNGKGV